MNPLNNFIGSSEARLVPPDPPPYGWGPVTGLTGHLAYKMKGEGRQAVFHHRRDGRWDKVCAHMV